MRHSWHTRLLAGFFIAATLPVHAEGADVARACELIGSRLKSVGAKSCLKAGLVASGAHSIKGVPLVYRDYAPRAAKSEGAPRRVLMIGGIHGDELTAVSIAFRWMGELERQRPQPFEWRVIPASNPDGLLNKPASTRTNSRGVDLNRNFPTPDWNERAVAYWKKKTGADKRRYPGPDAGSEQETHWLVQQIAEFKPDAIVSIHAPYGVLDFDGREEPPKAFGYLRLQQLGTYPGSLGNYGFSQRIPVITLELPSAGNMPTPQQTQRIWSDMLAWLEKNIHAANAGEHAADGNEKPETR